MKPVLGGIICIVAVSWIYLLTGAGMPTMDMGGGKVMLMPPPSWSIGYAAITFAMWSIMMVAMMVPSATPAILGIASRAEGASRAAFFIVGYVIVWIGFSAARDDRAIRIRLRACIIRRDGDSQRGGRGPHSNRGRAVPVVAIETKLLEALLLVKRFLRR